jgi:hypothetical protein
VIVSSAGDNPFRQFVAAWEAATAVAAEWAEKTAEVTAESFRKLASDPAIRAVIENWRIAPVFSRRDCSCPCATAHPDDVGICDHRAVITRRLTNHLGDQVDMPLCAPCAVAQGVAEMPH